MLEDEFDVDELICSLVCMRLGFSNTSFNVNNCWLGLPQLINLSTIRWNFDLFLTPCFLAPVLCLPLRQIDEVNENELDTLVSLYTTDELMSILFVLLMLP